MKKAISIYGERGALHWHQENPNYAAFSKIGMPNQIITRGGSIQREGSLSNTIIGKNTYEAIQSGLILGHASMIDSMLEKIILETGTNPKIVITGGLGEVIQPLLNVETEYSKDLTLNGLEEIYFLNN